LPLQRKRTNTADVEEVEDDLENMAIEEVPTNREMGCIDEVGFSSNVNRLMLTSSQDGDDIDSAIAPQERAAKAESSKDLLTIFSDCLEVKFTNKDGSSQQLRGRWCLICR
jgi:hypothetical protein